MGAPTLSRAICYSSMLSSLFCAEDHIPTLQVAPTLPLPDAGRPRGLAYAESCGRPASSSGRIGAARSVGGGSSVQNRGQRTGM
jgi:hypothetical protein